MDLFVVGGWDRFRAVSRDGREWGEASFSEKDSQFCTGIAFGDGRCGMLYKRGYFGASTLEISGDGENWEEFALKTDQPGHSLAYLDGKFIICTGKTIGSGHQPKAYLTEDGKKWSKAHEVGGPSIMTHYATGNGVLAGVGPAGMAAVTRDGAKWKVAELSRADTMISLAFGKGGFVGGGLHGGIMRSDDGLKWERVHSGEEGRHVNTMLAVEGGYLGIGLGATYRSADGVAWEAIPNENAPLSAVRGARGLLLGSQWKGRLLASRDGVRWSDEHEFERHVEALGFGSVAG